MSARPTTPDLLVAGDVWMIKLDTDSSLYRSVAAFLDPGASLAPGRKRKVRVRVRGVRVESVY